MSELLKRTIVSQVSNVYIQDLNIKLRNIGDSIDLLKPIISGTNSKKSRRTLEQIGASHDLDTALANGWIKLYDQDGLEIATLADQLEATNLLTLREAGSGSGSSDLSLSDLNDVNDLVSPNSGELIVGDGLEWEGLPIGGANKVIGANSSNSGLEYKTLTEGSNITISHGIGTITIASASPYSTFLSLVDTPDSFSSNGGKVVKVNSGATALEFTDEISTLVELTDVDDSIAFTAGNLIYGDGSKWTHFSVSGANKVLGINSSNNGLEYKTLTEGSNITITHGVGTITISTPDPTYTSFLSLTDTPNSYSGQSQKTVKVNSGETALEFVDDGIDYLKHFLLMGG